MTLRTGLLAGLIACAVLFGGLWFLNSTRAGLAIKCSLLNDVGACFLYELTEPIRPPAPIPTEDPAAAAERERKEASDRAQREADQAVASASTDLEWAVQALESLAMAAADEAMAMPSTTAELDAAYESLRREHDELAALIAAGSTGEFWVDDVSFALYDVEFARDGVDFAADGVEFSSYALDDLRESRSTSERDIEIAMSALRATQVRYPGAAPPIYAIADAEAALDRLAASIDESLAAHDATSSATQDVLDQADVILEQATALAQSVGAE